MFDHLVSVSQVITETPIWIYQYQYDGDREIVLRHCCLHQDVDSRAPMRQRGLLLLRRETPVAHYDVLRNMRLS